MPRRRKTIQLLRGAGVEQDLKMPHFEGRNPVSHSDELLRVLEAPELRKLMEKLFQQGEDAVEDAFQEDPGRISGRQNYDDPGEGAKGSIVI